MRNERGSALLVSLMVMVGLSLLGLGFIAISETESAISINERNASQVQATSEAGVRLAIEWFQDPDWALAQGLQPPNDSALKTQRVLAPAMGGTTYYKPTVDTILFDKPHKPSPINRFYGDEAHADIIINATTMAASGNTTTQNFLNNLNAAIFADTMQAGAITEIRVYAPPFTGATLNVNGFYEGGVRLGLATIAVTATKCRPNITAANCNSNTADSDVLAQKTSRAVISEWPFPGPSGPIQTNASLNTNGNMRVHWGRITAVTELTLKRPLGALPYHDAYETVRFQNGYSAFTDSGAGGVSDTYPTDTASADFRARYNWLYQIAGETLQDPWYSAWTRGDYLDDGVAGPFVVAPYNDPSLPLYDAAGGGICASDDGCRSIFQFQTTNSSPDRKSVLFPDIDYDFWKEIAISSDDQDGIFYLVRDTGGAGDDFQDKAGLSKSAEEWFDARPVGSSGPGFYFFETENNLNPQHGGPGILTEELRMNGWAGQAQGFIYLNIADWVGTGAGNTLEGYYGMPGEPYKDIGYWEVNPADGEWALDPLTGTAPKIVGASDGEWSCQCDLDFSATAASLNQFDYFVQSQTVTPPVGANKTEYFLVTYYPGCTPGTDCSEPHEPYLNYRYPALNGKEDLITIGWQLQTAQTRRPKKTDTEKPDGTPLPCNNGSAAADCTSNAYDRDGGLVELSLSLNGVMYIEGDFSQQGNMDFFGSILVEGDVDKAGTPNVWFDERLIKGEWPPKDFKFPRVYTSSIQTE